METLPCFIHPEVRTQVIKEFHRLHLKFPELSGDAKWAMARDYVWTLALADSAIIRCEMVI